jgi:hypothetical protein
MNEFSRRDVLKAVGSNRSFGRNQRANGSRVPRKPPI